MDDRIELICDLLLGAAHADNEFHQREKQSIFELMAKLMKVEEVPQSIKNRIEAFDPKDFDLRTCATFFAADPDSEKLRLLELIGAIHEADDEFCYAEDEYLREVGVALGVESARVESHAFDFEIDELQDSLSTLRAPK